LDVDPEYVRTWLRSDHVYGMIVDRAAGSTNQVELTAQMAINHAIPLPPLAEQQRIVSKVDELMALCDRLEAARSEREARRDKLTAASLGRLNAGWPLLWGVGQAYSEGSIRARRVIGQNRGLFVALELTRFGGHLST
jgi:type I restriction enzyme S subunit